MFGLFKGATDRIPARLAHAGPPTSHHCTVSYCTSRTTWQCAYTDATGAICGTHWCADHLLVVDRVPFCRRHAGVAGLLLSRVGTLLEMPIPRVDDRSLPLLLRIAAQLDERVVALLHHLYRERYDVEIAPHATIRGYSEQGQPMGWQAQWAATLTTGHQTVIGVRTSLGEPPRVAITRDRHVLREGIPDWILERDEDRWNGAGDPEFVDALFGALVGSFSGLDARPA